MLRALLFIVIFHFLAGTQQKPVRWKFYSTKGQGDSIEIHMKAAISKGWHLFALNNRAGPGATEVNLIKHSGIKFDGMAVRQSQPKQVYDQVFKANVLAFINTAEFMQVVSRKDTTIMSIGGFVRYMVCNGSNCLPPISDSFQVKIN